MADSIVRITDDFWNILGDFRIAGINIGTQASLARLSSGGWVMLDSYTLTGEVERKVMELTDGGDTLEAIVNLHPFHTVHVKKAAAAFPNAKLYGAARHHERAPELTWQPERVEDEAFADVFADDFDFSVPRGVQFVCDDPKLHFSSVLAIHKTSKTLHVDDTLTTAPLVGLIFHPTLKSMLEPRAGAAADFRAWAQSLIARCQDIQHLCTAHLKKPIQIQGPGDLSKRIEKALGRVEKVLRKHEKRYGA